MMMPCSSSMRKGFENYKRKIPFSALRACGFCPKRSLDLTYLSAEWSTCH
jgi:hypothetical protein